MRVRITDSAALRKISPSQITAYLRARGAKQVGTFLDRAAIWALGEEEFLVPVAAEFADYAYRVADILAALERVEEHSQLEILDELHEVGFDVVGIGRFPKDETSEALGIMRAVDFLAHARDLLMAAACAASTRKACSPAERSQDAERFMQSVRLDKMEGYGFVVRLLAPVAPERKGSTDSSAELYALYMRGAWCRYCKRALRDYVLLHRRSVWTAVCSILKRDCPGRQRKLVCCPDRHAQGSRYQKPGNRDHLFGNKKPTSSLCPNLRGRGVFPDD